MNSYSRAQGETRHLLDLPGGRQIEYAHNGPATSRTVVLFFHGLFGVGNAGDVPQTCREAGMHWIAPTLPGMGRSSARADRREPYHAALARDTTALLAHLYPTDAYDALYVSGGSYGTVQAQMLYGAPHSLFPPGRRIVACLLLAGFSPARHDRQYAKALSWQNWFSIGPPTQLVPFHLLQWLVSCGIASKLKTLDGAKEFLHSVLVSRMDRAEEDRLAAYLDKTGRTREAFVETMARGTMHSCRSWEGFYEVSDVIHSDWGFDPAALEHEARPVLIVGSEDDHIGSSNNLWLAATYKSATLKTLPGGHISALGYLDSLWEELMQMARPKSPDAL